MAVYLLWAIGIGLVVAVIGLVVYYMTPADIDHQTLHKGSEFAMALGLITAAISGIALYMMATATPV